MLIQEKRSITLSAGQLHERWECNVLGLYMYNSKRDTDATIIFFLFFGLRLFYTYFL